jgi:hypothetical protein
VWELNILGFEDRIWPKDKQEEDGGNFTNELNGLCLPPNVNGR